MTVLPRLSAEQIAEIARAVSITDHISGMRTPWTLNAAQVRILRELEQHPFVYVTKPRQIGATSVVTFDDVLAVAVADAAGHKMRCGIVVDTDEKTRERMKLAADFCEQLGLGCSANVDRVVFPGGSEIVGMTAGGNRAGASTTFQRLHLSELPFWPDGAETYAALMPALAPGGVCVIETTMDTKTPLARDLWRSENNYRKLFFPVEEHHEYVADARALSEEKEKWLRGEGFTRPESMAWWLWALDNLCGGDVVRCMREFPQKPEHMFQASTARWVRLTPDVRTPVDRLRFLGAQGDEWFVDVYQKPENTTRDMLIGVDTAAGKERDRSVVAVVDRISRQLCACLVSDRIYADDLAKAAHTAQVHYTSLDAAGRVKRPLALIEDNGVGEMTCQQAERLGVFFERVTMDEEKRYRGLLEAKRAVEAGQLAGPKELAEECDELHRDEHGRFKGRKDILMAYGFCGVKIAESPVVQGPAEEKNDERRIRGKKMLHQQMARARMGMW